MALRCQQVPNVRLRCRGLFPSSPPTSSLHPSCYPGLRFSLLFCPLPALSHQTLAEQGRGCCQETVRTLFPAGPSSEWSLRGANDGPPAPEGPDCPLSPPQTLLTEALRLSHTLGDIPGAMGDTPGPHASKAQSTRVWEMQERKPLASSPRLCPLLLESSQAPTPSLGSWDASTGQRCRVQSLNLAAFLFGLGKLWVHYHVYRLLSHTG